MNTAEFLHELYGGVSDGVLEITYLAPEGVRLYPRTVVQWAALPLGAIDFENSTARQMNHKGYNVYYGVAVRRAAKPSEQRISDKTGKSYTFYPRGNQSDALYLTTLYVDIDDASDDARWRIWALCPPSIVVFSGGGWHGYWVLNEPLLITDDNRHNITRTLKGMAIACGGDTKVAELARIMRLPGTVNTKPERGGAIAEIVEDMGGARFRFEDFERRFARLGGPRELVIDRPIPIEASQGLPKWVGEYLATGAPVGERNNRLYAVAREYKANGLSASQCTAEAGARGLSDGLTDEEVDRTIRSAYAAQGVANIDPSFKTRIAAQDAMLRARDRRGA